MYYALLDDLKKNYQEDKIMDGQFGAHMEVNIVNDGPVTLEIEAPAPKDCKPQSSTAAPGS